MIALASVVVFAGAQDKKKPPEKKPAPEKEMGVVKGTVTFKGDPIPKQKIQYAGNQPECAGPDPRKYLTQREIVDPTTRAIANVFVAFRGPPQGMTFAAAKAAHVVEQKT
jgi:hypothetical protein